MRLLGFIIFAIFFLQVISLFSKPLDPAFSDSNMVTDGAFENFSIRENKGVIQLTWTVAKEEVNDLFLVLRSTDGIRFEPIGLKNGKTADNVGRLSFTDHNPEKDLYYYKLFRIKLTGGAEYSCVKAAYRNKNSYAEKNYSLNRSMTHN